MFRALVALSVMTPLSVSSSMSPALSAPLPPRSAPAVPPMHDTVSRRIIPQQEALLQLLLRDGRATTLDGVRIFESGDKFLPGKIAIAMYYRIADLPPGDPRLAQRLKDFATIAALTIDDENETWGLYYYISALHQLRARGLLERAVPPATLARLREQLDWRRFVAGDLTLKGLPNNYYGVAFSIARLRYLLGWEDAAGSDRLIARTLDHYRRYSGQYGFADETEGEGRFDRYSVLLIGEIAQRMIETGMTPPAEVRAWLRQSVDLMLPRLNQNGEGFEFGRSIGPYGETAFLEVLTAAARLKVLTPTEERMAYAFSARVVARYMAFWVDPATGSVDLWGHGRRTDAYRGKHRIFGENLSLGRQMIYTDAIWNDLGYRGRRPDPGFTRWLTTLPRVTATWFARGTYDRALVTVRDGHRTIGLPIINGASGQHMHNPYFPIPFAAGMLQGSADADFPQLIPRITLDDGSVLMPLAFFKDVRIARDKAAVTVRWHQDTLDHVGADNARADPRVTIATRYRLESGRIVREDTLAAKAPARIAKVELEFATFSQQATTTAATTRFARGAVRSFTAAGFPTCAARPVDSEPYRAATGAFATVVRCTLAPPAGRPIALGWTLTYDPWSDR